MRLKTQVRIVALVALAGLFTGLALLLRAEAGPLLAVMRSDAELDTVGRLDALVHELQRERGLSQAQFVDLAARPLLAAQYARTDRALAEAGADLRDARELAALEAHRAQLLGSAVDAQACHLHYSALIEPLLRRGTVLAREHVLDALGAPLAAHAALARAKEQLGQLRALVLQLLAEPGSPRAPVQVLQQLAVFDATAAAALEDADGDLADALRRLLASDAMQAARERAESLALDRAKAAWGDAQAWYATASQTVDAMHALQQDSLARLRDLAAREARSAAAGLAWRSALVALAWLGSCWLVFVALRRLLATIRRLDTDARALLGRLNAAGGDADTGPGDLDEGFMWLVERVDRLSQQASTDALTGVLNRHGLLPLFAAERERALRYGRPLSLVVVDIDHFKQVNDRHGHATGDVVLRAFAQLLRESIRTEDIVARWGGEEFVVVVPECDLAAAAALADKLRVAVAAHAFALPQRLSASFGVAELADGEDLDALVRRADTALYRAKSLGRDRVCRAAPAEARRRAPLEAPAGR